MHLQIMSKHSQVEGQNCMAKCIFLERKLTFQRGLDLNEIYLCLILLILLVSRTGNPVAGKL